MTVVEQIVARQTAAVIVYESDQVIAFADHDPINPGHILVCPKLPFATLLEVPAVVLAEINDVAKVIYARIEAKFSPDGITLVQNNGHVNELNHYHLHIIPRYENDTFQFARAGQNLQSQEQLQAALTDF